MNRLLRATGYGVGAAGWLFIAVSDNRVFSGIACVLCAGICIFGVFHHVD